MRHADKLKVKFEARKLRHKTHPVSTPTGDHAYVHVQGNTVHLHTEYTGSTYGPELSLTPDQADRLASDLVRAARLAR